MLNSKEIIEKYIDVFSEVLVESYHSSDEKKLNIDELDEKFLKFRIDASIKLHNRIHTIILDLICKKLNLTYKTTGVPWNYC